MKQTSKYILLIMVLCIFIFQAGCSIPGSSGVNKNSNRTITITGNIISPDVNIPGFLPSVFESLSASSTCLVNDLRQTCLIASDSTFIISNVPYSPTYRVKLTSGYLNLYTIIEDSGNSSVIAPFGLSNRSTAEYFLRQSYAYDMGLPISDLTTYNLDISLIDELAAVINSNLSNASSSIDILDSALAAKKTEILKRKSFFKAMHVKEESSYYDESWKGDVYYHLLDSSGKKSLGVSAEAKFNITINGDKLYGNAEIIPDLGAFQSDLTFYFEGRMEDGVVTFRRRGTGGTVSEPLLEQWTLFPTTRGLAIKSENIDFFLKRGLEFDPARSFMKVDHFSTW